MQIDTQSRNRRRKRKMNNSPGAIVICCIVAVLLSSLVLGIRLEEVEQDNRRLKKENARYHDANLQLIEENWSLKQYILEEVEK